MTWKSWLKPRKVMGIAMRLALVVGVVAGVWSFVRMHLKYVDAWYQAHRIDMALSCARGLTDEELAKHKNPFGLVDLGKTFCAERSFLASMEEIRVGIEPIHERVPYRHYVYQESILGDALIGALAMVALGLAIVFLRWLGIWVLGSPGH